MKKATLVTLATLVAGCSAPAPNPTVVPLLPAEQAAPALSAGYEALPRIAIAPQTANNSILIQLKPANGFSTKAAAKQLNDIDHYVVKLYNQSGPTLVHTHTTPNGTNTAFYFNNVPDGTYTITAEAFDSSASITQGGAQSSSNSATVAGTNVTYSSGTALTASLSLLNQTASQLDSALTVTPGSNAPAITVTPH